MAKRCILIADTLSRLEELGKEEIMHYVRNFPKEIDYNIAQYGNMLVYYDDIRELMDRAGYKVEKYTNEKIWDFYKKLVGAVVYEFYIL